MIRPFTDPASVNRAVSSSGSESQANAPRPRPQLTLRGASRMPDVSAAGQCAPSITAEINRLRRNQVTMHGEPACTEDYGGEWAAVFATGTEQEASDVWVVVAASGRVEHHRVRRTPYGVRYTAISIYRGLAVLTGRSIQSEEMPANAEALVAFAIPFPGNPAPAVLELQPALTPILGASDRLDLDNRLQGLVAESEASSDTVRPVLARCAEGPRGLIGALPSTQSVPVVRGWQLGVYERLGDMHAQLDPTNARVSTGHEIIRRIAERGGCDEGWRCVVRPEGRRELPESAVAPQAQFKRVGATTVIAAILDAGTRPEALGQPSPDRMSAPRSNDPQDRLVAQRLALDPIEGPVAGASRGPVKFIAFTTVEGERRVTHVYAVSPNRAPRRFEDDSNGRVINGARQVQIRDIDGNEEPEVLIASRFGANGVVSVSTLFWPPTVTDRLTFARLDATRALVDAHNLDEADRALRSFQPSPFENEEQLCQVVSRIAQTTPRQLAPLVPSPGFTVIDYATPGQPLRGEVRRMTSADLRNAADIAAVFGPFANAPCNEMECDSTLGFCKLRRGGRELGYLWLGPRRNQPYWGISRASGR
ncbi:MAG: hypothetical protein JNK05_20640 [Myxococcales bacterium]|nr:hypothetical protein [Myxococcales bacterium]